MNSRGFLRSTLLCVLSMGVVVPGCDSSSADDTSSGSGESGSSLVCDEAWVDKPDSSAVDIQTMWGSACESDADCSHLGEGGECFKEVLGVFEMPGGACTIRCELPDSGTTVVPDDPQCDPNGGIACMGAKGIFSACLPTCTNDSQCGRESYGCVQMPVISAPGDATFCLMNPDACCLDPSMCT